MTPSRSTLLSTTGSPSTLGASVLADVRYALRQVARAPMFTAVILCVLAIGIGANSAVFTIVRAYTTRPAPGIPNAGQLARLTEIYANGKYRSDNGVSYATFAAIRDRVDIFADAAAWGGYAQTSVEAKGRAAPANVLPVTDGYFAALDLHMARGVGFGSRDGRDSIETPAAVVSYGYWQRLYGGDSGIVGTMLKVGGTPMTIVGVAPERFNGVSGDAIDVYVPLSMTPMLFPPQFGQQTTRFEGSYSMLVRLRHGVTPRYAAAVASTIVQQQETMGETWFSAHDSSITADPQHNPVLHVRLAATIGPLSAMPRGEAMQEMGAELAILGGVSGLILLIACANVSSLLLGRAVARRREIAVRLSLGAGRRRVIRQLVTESILLALISSLMGVLLAAWIAAAAAVHFELGLDVAPDWQTIAFSVAFATGTGIVFGILPALHATRASVSDALKEGAAGPDRQGSRWQGALTITQIALSAVFVSATGIFVGGAVAARNTPFGIHHEDQLLSAKVDLGLAHTSALRAEVLLAAARQRIAALPGVSAMSVTTSFPLLDDDDPNHMEGVMEVGDSEIVVPMDTLSPWVVKSDPELFSMGVLPFRRGRPIESTDAPGSPAVALVSEDLARRMWPHADPIGQTLKVPNTNDAPAATVVGVVGTLHMTIDSTELSPVIYLSLRQFPDTFSVIVLVRTAGDPDKLVVPLRNALTSLDPQLYVHDVRTFAASREAAVALMLDVFRYVGLLSALALLLACIGVYAVIVFRVGQRTREIGIRMALGANANEVTGLFFRSGMRLGVIGISAGFLLAFGVTRLLMHFHPEAPPVIDSVVVAFALIMPIVIAVATWVPARRAARVDPLVALRSE